MCYKFIYFVLLIVLLSLLFIFLHFLLYPMRVNSLILLYYFVMLFSKVFKFDHRQVTSRPESLQEYERTVALEWELSFSLELSDWMKRNIKLKRIAMVFSVTVAHPPPYLKR